MPVLCKGKNTGNATIEVGDYFLLPNHRSKDKEHLLVRVVQILNKFPDESDIRYVLCSEDFLLRGAYYADELTHKVAIVEDDEQFPMLSTYTGAKSAPFHVCMRLYRQKLKLLEEQRKIADDLSASMEEKEKMKEKKHAEMVAARDNEIQKTQNAIRFVGDGRMIPDHTYQLESDDDAREPGMLNETGVDMVTKIKKEKFADGDAGMEWAGLEEMGLEGDGFYFGDEADNGVANASSSVVVENDGVGEGEETDDYSSDEGNDDEHMSEDEDE